MRNRDLTLDQAKDILAHIVSQRERWGVQYDGSEIGLEPIMEALITLAKHENQSDAEMREQITKLNRQLGAANARETKLKNELKELRDGG
jgi:hypothetical protein